MLPKEVKDVVCVPEKGTAAVPGRGPSLEGSGPPRLCQSTLRGCPRQVDCESLEHLGLMGKGWAKLLGRPRPGSRPEAGRRARGSPRCDTKEAGGHTGPKCGRPTF